MKLIRFFTAAALLLGTVLAFAGCTAEEYEPLELIPEGSAMLGQVKIGDILRDYKIYYELTDDTESAEAVEKIKEEFADNTGIDMDDVSQIFLFGSQESLQGSEIEDVGMIMTGNFADRDLVENIAEKTGQTFTSAKYGDHTLYTGSEGESALVKVNNTLIVLGAEDAVKDCIDVIDGKKETVSGTVVENFENLGDTLFRISMLVPDEATEGFETPGDPMMPISMDSFTEIETVGVSGDMDITSLTIKATLGFTDADAAKEASDLFQLILGVFSMLGEDEDVSELLGRIDITTEDAAMLMTMEIPLEDLAAMIQSMESGEGFPLSPMLPGMDSTDEIEIPPPSSGK